MSNPKDQFTTGRQYCAGELGKHLEKMLVKGVFLSTKALAQKVREEKIPIILNEKSKSLPVEPDSISEESLIRRCHLALLTLSGRGLAIRKPATGLYSGYAQDKWAKSTMIEKFGRKDNAG